MQTFVFGYLYFGMLPTSQNLNSNLFLMNNSKIALLKQKTMFSSVKNYLWVQGHHFKVARKNNSFFKFLMNKKFSMGFWKIFKK